MIAFVPMLEKGLQQLFMLTSPDWKQSMAVMGRKSPFPRFHVFFLNHLSYRSSSVKTTRDNNTV
jgi:hypothetical protein